MNRVEPGVTLEFADEVLGMAKARYRIKFGLGSTVDTVTFDVGWHGGRDDNKAIELATAQAKPIESELHSGTGEVVFLSCEFLEHAEELEKD